MDFSELRRSYYRVRLAFMVWRFGRISEKELDETIRLMIKDFGLYSNMKDSIESQAIGMELGREIMRLAEVAHNAGYLITPGLARTLMKISLSQSISENPRVITMNFSGGLYSKSGVTKPYWTDKTAKEFHAGRSEKRDP